MNLDDVLGVNREKIFHTISNALHTKGTEKYRQRPFTELMTTTSEATDGFYATLIDDDDSKINSFIERIAHLRLSAGFGLSDVQTAFDFYRLTVVPILGESLDKTALLDAVNELNSCFTYTITTFSEYFQALHERQIREHVQNLEKEVARRVKELFESEAKYRMLVEEIDDGYFVSRNGRILFANKAFCDMHGYPPEELIGRRYIDLAAPESTSRLRELCSGKRSPTDVPEQYIYYRRHKDGRSLPTENKTKVMVYQGKYATAGVCRDVTERMDMEQRLRDAENLAHIGHLSASLAHEIRNPLSSIKMGIQILLKTAELDMTGKRTMEISAKEIGRVERLLEQMLDLAKPVSLTLQETCMNSVINSCIEILDAVFRAKKIVLNKKLSPRVKPAMIDKEKMEQVIINILLNAAEALPACGTISIVTKRQLGFQSGIRVEISDNGPGIDNTLLPHMFDPFFSKKKQGIGLGLAIVKKILEAHGGTVRAIAKRKGLSMSFWLPVKGKS